MEIITYVLEGALQHRDSLGNGSVIRPGEVQRMSAGRGMTQREFDASQTELVHFLQIWIMPEQAGLVPSYEQTTIDLSAARGGLSPIASGQGGQGVVKLHRDAQYRWRFWDAVEGCGSVPLAQDMHGCRWCMVPLR
jgi:redox-sensitive bicupin YhaK (pirin superfamily)